jgi:integrase/recombinase XerD
MSQAKTLNEKDLKLLLASIATKRHAPRNRAMVMMSVLAGMRVCEIAALRVSDVVASDGTIKDQINLGSDQTKGHRDRVVMIGHRLQRELRAYVDLMQIRCIDGDRPFFYSQRTRRGFNANTLCQHFTTMYRDARIDGAKSHSGRRTFITNLANRGVGVRVLMALAGHRNMSTTQRYIDLNDDMMKVAVNML